MEVLSLDFLYTPSDDVDRDVAQHLAAFGAELEWKVRAMGTVVACLRVSQTGPRVLLTEHLDGTTPILVYRVTDYEEAVRQARAAGATDVRELEIPHGPCASFRLADGAHVAVYQLVRPEAAEHFVGRFDD